MSDEKEPDPPRRGCLTDAQRAELRAILADEYRGTLTGGTTLILDGFIVAQAKVPPAVIEFDFLPDPKAAPEPEPVPFVIDLKPDPVAAFVGVLMANPDEAALVRRFLRVMLPIGESAGKRDGADVLRMAAAVRRVLDMSEPKGE